MTTRIVLNTSDSIATMLLVADHVFKLAEKLTQSPEVRDDIEISELNGWLNRGIPVNRFVYSNNGVEIGCYVSRTAAMHDEVWFELKKGEIERVTERINYEVLKQFSSSSDEHISCLHNLVVRLHLIKMLLSERRQGDKTKGNKESLVASLTKMARLISGG